MKGVAEARRTFEIRLEQARQAAHQQLGLRPDRAWLLPMIGAAGGIAVAGLLVSAWRAARSRQRRSPLSG